MGTPRATTSRVAQLPVIDLPDTEPESVMAAERTVPKLMAVPFTVPLMPVMLRVELAFESVIVPLNRDRDCLQRRVNVPW